MRGDGGGVGTGAADVADHERPATVVDRRTRRRSLRRPRTPRRRPSTAQRSSSPSTSRQPRREQAACSVAGDRTVLLGQPHVVQRFGDAPRDSLCERDVLVVVDPARLGADELHRADRAPVGVEGHGDDAREVQLVEQVEDIAPPGFVGVHRVERSGDVLRRDLSQELEATSADHRRDPARLVRVIGVPLSHQRRPLDLRRIDVCDLDLGCSPGSGRKCTVHQSPSSGTAAAVTALISWR